MFIKFNSRKKSATRQYVLESLNIDAMLFSSFTSLLGQFEQVCIIYM